MKFSFLVAGLAGAALTVALASDPGRGSPEEVLDAPGGRPIAILLSGAQPRVLEQRDGYARVVLEGWVRSPATGGPSLSNEPGDSMAPPTVGGQTPPSDSGKTEGTVSGSILVTLPGGAVRKGAGARVVLLKDVPELEASRKEIAAAFQKAARGLEKEISELDARRRAALNSSENLGQATQDLDRAKRDLASKNKELDSLKATYGSREGVLIDQYAAKEGTSGMDGTFRFAGIPPGEYRLWAAFSEAEAAYRWYLPAVVEPGRDSRVDLVSQKPGQDPFLTIP